MKSVLFTVGAFLPLLPPFIVVIAIVGVRRMSKYSWIGHIVTLGLLLCVPSIYYFLLERTLRPEPFDFNIGDAVGVSAYFLSAIAAVIGYACYFFFFRKKPEVVTS
jgi:hypothetical protein